MIKTIKTYVKLCRPGIDVSAVGATIINTGTVAYFPPPLAVVSHPDAPKETIRYDFGKVKNVGDADTEVILELAYKIHRSAENASDVSVVAKLNGNELDLPKFDIIQNVRMTRTGGRTRTPLTRKCNW